MRAFFRSRRISRCLAAMWLTVCCLIFGTGCSEGDRPVKQLSPQINCDIQAGGCTRQTDFGTVGLEILPRPVRVMTDLRFIVTVDPGLSAAGKPLPYIDLDMPAMSMGYNRVFLTQAPDGRYEGSGVIVRCPSGIPVWQADVVFPDTGTAVFVFEVVY